MKTRYVYLGRFAPFHNGHKRLLSEMVRQFGSESVIVMIGSTNTLNARTPYIYEDRAEIIRVSFPEIEIIPLPDGKPNLEYFDGTTNEAWLDSIESIAREKNEEFIFCGGSRADLEVLATRFKTIVLVSRQQINISATEIRKAIASGKIESLTEMVDSKAVELIVNKIKTLI